MKRKKKSKEREKLGVPRRKRKVIAGQKSKRENAGAIRKYDEEGGGCPGLKKDVDVANKKRESRARDLRLKERKEGGAGPNLGWGSKKISINFEYSSTDERFFRRSFVKRKIYIFSFSFSFTLLGCMYHFPFKIFFPPGVVLFAAFVAFFFFDFSVSF